MGIYLVKYQNNKVISCERTRKYAMLRDHNSGQLYDKGITQNKVVVEVYIRTEDEADARKQAAAFYRKNKQYHTDRPLFKF